jgi:catechol 2,3-dioxygenase-like lactoylglutathione lyase family enzyme|tara:strand:+ start:88 stop:450 length:363 start_codon:yes stop_codon:yes gene_type:complete
MPKYSLEHVHLNSNDPVNTAAFYEKMLGAKITGTGAMPDGRKNVTLDIGGLALRITEPAEPKNVALDHIGLETDDIEKAIADMKAEGVAVVKEIGPLRGGKFAFFLAPDDVLIELIERGK